MNLTTATATTVLPCSSYLSAQSTYIASKNDPEILDDYFWPFDPSDGSDLSNWNIDFGQSPECRSYVDAMNEGKYTFSDCGSRNIIQTAGDFDYPSQVPPGLERYLDPGSIGYKCCGNCSLSVPEVRLYYFPDKMTIDCHNNQTLNSTSSLLAESLRKRVHSLVVNESTTVVSGHTL